ncbi:hypothetical protein DL771_009535 [Monosporascus sp. 5C6A]|nr:hypothetical protein DL771_009535 [Monosporascus sp. 5C6A]
MENHAAGIVFSGSGLKIDGDDTGLIDGDGDAWYGTEQGKTRPGRPTPSSSGASRTWTLNGGSWHISVQPRYRGGDDCVAIKPRSYGTSINNVTCIGGNGGAIGSLGHYLEDSSIEDVVFDGVSVLRDLQNLRDSAYVKTWMGELLPQDSYQSGGLPRGGGWGLVRNITFRNFRLHGPNHGSMITQNVGNNGRGFEGTSKVEVRDALFENWTGFLAGETRMATFGCSFVHPCSGIEGRNVSLLNWSQGIPVDNGMCYVYQVW